MPAKNCVMTAFTESSGVVWAVVAVSKKESRNNKSV
jgi:hypothetical protein